MFLHWKAKGVQVEREIKALPSSEKKMAKENSNYQIVVDHVIIMKENCLKHDSSSQNNVSMFERIFPRKMELGWGVMRQGTIFLSTVRLLKLYAFYNFEKNKNGNSLNRQLESRRFYPLVLSLGGWACG